ncbi:alpha/beta fold hydrolase [Pseudonocardia spinosispora]|uniref:alpha/beta fold hydrolase n=1 Tax=Pseudonocardia spinosispora TaxID=103441 RepID=UPI000A06B0CE|nr:alpha/beta hydrolase [Pseudonocardia spinosispora]
MVMGTGSPGRVWKLHQVPALVAAGFRVVTFDSRGIGASPPAGSGLTIDDLVGDVASLIEHLGGGPAHVVGTSLGARVVQELALARPELVGKVVAMAAHARLDPVQSMFTSGQQALFDQGVTLPPAYHSAVTAVLNLSPATLRDEKAARDWLDVLEFSAGPMSAGERAQLAVSTQLRDRRDAYRDIRAPLLVVGFADDVMIPCALSREVADVVPGARYSEIPDTGHFGYLERPGEVNRLLVEFLGS